MYHRDCMRDYNHNTVHKNVLNIVTDAARASSKRAIGTLMIRVER